MPASSRKRNKGKDRKAKKVEKDRVRINNIWRGWWLIGDPHKGTTIQCNHGLPMFTMLDSHPVSIFMDAYFTYWYDTRMCVLEILIDLFLSHQVVYNSDEYRSMVIQIFTRIGTNMVLTGDADDISNAGGFAKVIMILEHFVVGDGDIIEPISRRVVASKCRDLEYHASSTKRDALKFYRKRTTCSCLRKMHLETRKCITKVGECMNCKEEKERVSLSVCSRCMITQFCSRECYVANWPEHKVYCDRYVKTQAQNTMGKECSDG